MEANMEAMRMLGGIAGLVNQSVRDVDSKSDFGITPLDPRAAENAMRVSLTQARPGGGNSAPPPGPPISVPGMGGFVNGGNVPPSNATMIPMPDDLSDRLVTGWSDPVYGTPPEVVQAAPTRGLVPPMQMDPRMGSVTTTDDQARWDRLFDYLETIKNILEYLATPDQAVSDVGSGEENDKCRDTFPPVDL